jgi:hypothetical protein
MNLGMACICFLLISALFVVWQPIYGKASENANYWNYDKRFNWGSAITWIRSNTTPHDVLASVYAEYFAWYTNRQTFFLWSVDSNANMSTLVSLIRTAKINYLVVDLAFSWHFSNLRGLYNSPTSFLGSTIVFTDQINLTAEVVIYNVTNIAYGTLSSSMLELEWGKLDSWEPLSFYSAGNISATENSIRFEFKVKDTLWPSAAGTFKFLSPMNLSQYSSIAFWVMTSNPSFVVSELYSGKQGQNYYAYLSTGIESGAWFRIAFDLKSYHSVFGTPSFDDIVNLNFIIGAQKINDVVTFEIRDISFYSERYVLG